MTLNDIIYSALRHLERGHDAQTVDKYRKVFTDYANSAQFEIAKRISPNHMSEVELDDKGRFDVAVLPRSCYLIEKITSTSGSELSWSEICTGLIEVANGANQLVTILYKYIPADLSSSTDVPQLPEYTHRAIPYYVVACHNRDTGKTSQTDFFDVFNRHLIDMQNFHYGDAEKNKLKNLGW